MNDEIKNIAASVKDRLLNIAKEKKINFNQILLLYFHERLLYRLSKSKYSSNFLLKGGVLILSTTNFKTRPTKDIDFLGQHISSNPEEIKNIFQEICQIEYQDGVKFDLKSITAEKIIEGVEYEGIRVKVVSYLGTAQRKLQLDIGYGDVIIPEPQRLEYPGLLNLERPIINAYSLESVIAEKFEAMLRLSTINSRMKDFYDLYVISDLKSFDGRVLQEAISTTLQKRGTPLEENPIIFREEFANNKQRLSRWNGYLNKIGGNKINFSKVMMGIKVFLSSIYTHILEEEEFFKHWNNNQYEWEEYQSI